MRSITSVHNLEIKHVVKLHQAKERKQHNQTFAEGLRTLQTLIASGISIEKLYVTQEQQAYAYKLNAQETNIVSSEVMAKISLATTPSGILGVFSPPDYQNLDTLTAGLVLAQISDPGNMGTLLRTAAACNVKSVVIVEGTDPWSPKVIQSSAGTLAQVNLFHCEWHALVTSKKSLELCALIVDGGQTPQEIKLHNQNNLLLVVGNEAHGIPQSWQNQCSVSLSLPMPGGTESLNAAVAGSIALYLMYVL